MAAAVGRILQELGFFLALVLLSEASRRYVARKRSPDSQLAQALLICSLVLGWYSVSITLVLFNKWVVSSWGDGGLKFPIFYSMTHMLFKGIFSFSYQRCVRCKRLPTASRRVLLGTALVGVMTGLDVALSNQSFLYISVSFYTMLKSASLVFLMALGVATGIEPCSFKVGGAVAIIAGGILLASYGEARFDVRGFTLVIASELFAAIRWIVTQMVLHGSSLGTMVTVFYMSPASTLTLLPLALALELHEISSLSDPSAAVQYVGVVIFPGFLAFLLLLIEVQLVKETSSLTLSVFGNLKSVVTILFAILVFGEEASALQWCGLAAALSGMFAYSYIKKKAMEVDALASLGYEALPQDEEDLMADNGSGIFEIGASPTVEAPPDAKLGSGDTSGREAGQSPADGVAPAGGRVADEASRGCEPQVLGLPSALRSSASGARAAEPAAPAGVEPRPLGAGVGREGSGAGTGRTAAEREEQEHRHHESEEERHGIGTEVHQPDSSQSAADVVATASGPAVPAAAPAPPAAAGPSDAAARSAASASATVEAQPPAPAALAAAARGEGGDGEGPPPIGGGEHAAEGGEDRSPRHCLVGPSGPGPPPPPGEVFEAPEAGREAPEAAEVAEVVVAMEAAAPEAAPPVEEGNRV